MSRGSIQSCFALTPRITSRRAETTRSEAHSGRYVNLTVSPARFEAARILNTRDPRFPFGGPRGVKSSIYEYRVGKHDVKHDNVPGRGMGGGVVPRPGKFSETR